jgi:hypothetical protein
MVKDMGVPVPCDARKGKKEGKWNQENVLKGGIRYGHRVRTEDPYPGTG